MEMVVNPRYSALTDILRRIPDMFESATEVIQNYRNDIRIWEIGGCKVVVKSFKGMYLPNQLAYSLFRKSKAKRSYETSLKLLHIQCT
jgi:hypothetical protein